MLYKVVLSFKSEDETLAYDHLNESYNHEESVLGSTACFGFPILLFSVSSLGNPRVNYVPV